MGFELYQLQEPPTKLSGLMLQETSLTAPSMEMGQSISPKRMVAGSIKPCGKRASLWRYGSTGFMPTQAAGEELCGWLRW